MPYKLRFQRFIPGRANLINVDINLIGKGINPLLMDLDCEIAQYHRFVDIWTTVEDYPPIIEIDTRLIFPHKPFKFIDLQGMLPEGVWLHRKYDNVMQTSIASMGENFNYLLSSNLYPIEELREEGDFNQEQGQELMQMQEAMKLAGKNKLKKKPTMPFQAASSKKLMQTKTEGADPAALRKLMTSGSKSDKKPKKK